MEASLHFSGSCVHEEVPLEALTEGRKSWEGQTGLNEEGWKRNGIGELF